MFFDVDGLKCKDAAAKAPIEPPFELGQFCFFPFHFISQYLYGIGLGWHWPFAYFECENSIVDTSHVFTGRGQFVPLGSSCKAVCPNKLYKGVGKDLNKRVDTLMDTLTCTRPLTADQWHSDEYWKMVMSRSPQLRSNFPGEEYFEKNWYDTPIKFGFSGSPHISFFPVSSLPETDIWRAYKSGVINEVAKRHEIIDTTCDHVISNESISVECSDGNNPGSICSMQCKAGMIILYSTQSLFLSLT